MLSELISPDFLFSLMLLQKLKPAHQSNAYFVLHSKILWYHFFFRLVGNLYQTYKLSQTTACSSLVLQKKLSESEAASECCQGK